MGWFNDQIKGMRRVDGCDLGAELEKFRKGLDIDTANIPGNVVVKNSHIQGSNGDFHHSISAMNASLGGIAGGGPPAPPPYAPMEKLLMRLNVRESSQSGFNYIAAIANSEKQNVVVFIITKTGEALHVEDDGALFPTDGLVARLNILRG